MAMLSRTQHALANTQVGHFQLLDRRTFLQESACSLGRINEGAVRGLCAGLLLTWLQLSSSGMQYTCDATEALLREQCGVKLKGDSLLAQVAVA